MKKYLTAGFLTLLPLLTQAQIDIGNEITKQGNSFIKAFSVLAVIGLIVVFIFNLEHFTSKGGDTKKGITALIVYAVIVGLVIVIAQSLRGINL